MNAASPVPTHPASGLAAPRACAQLIEHGPLGKSQNFGQDLLVWSPVSSMAASGQNWASGRWERYTTRRRLGMGGSRCRLRAGFMCGARGASSGDGPDQLCAAVQQGGSLRAYHVGFVKC